MLCCLQFGVMSSPDTAIIGLKLRLWHSLHCYNSALLPCSLERRVNMSALQVLISVRELVGA